MPSATSAWPTHSAAARRMRGLTSQVNAMKRVSGAWRAPVDRLLLERRQIHLARIPRYRGHADDLRAIEERAKLVARRLDRHARHAIDASRHAAHHLARLLDAIDAEVIGLRRGIHARLDFAVCRQAGDELDDNVPGMVTVGA